MYHCDILIYILFVFVSWLERVVILIMVENHSKQTKNNPTILSHALKTAGPASRPLLLCSHAHPNNLESSSHCQLHTT